MEFIDKKYVELINKEIDHIITPEEKTRLHRYLSDNKVAQDYYYGLLKTNDYLNQLPDQGPSENLKKQIINSLGPNKYNLKVKRQSAWSFIFAPKFKIAYTFAIGLIAGIIIYAVLANNSDTININDVYGTIGINNNSAITIEKFPLEFSDISGKVELKSVNKNFWFNLNLNSANKFDVVISYPEQVKFENIRLGLAKNIEVSKGQNFIKTTNAGAQKYSLLFSQINPEPVTLKIQFLQSGNILFERKLSVNQ